MSETSPAAGQPATESAPDKLTDLLSAQLPIGPMPTSPGQELDDWLDLVKAQTELTKMLEDHRKADVSRRQAEMELERDEMALEKERLEHEDLLRKAKEDEASADHHRIYTFDKEVSHSSVAKAMDRIGMWSRRDPGCDITLLINSPGGSVFAGLAFYDQLQQLRAAGHKVITQTLGMAASMGGILLQAGDERLIGANASVLIHEVSSGMWGKTSALADELRLTERLQSQLLDILASRSKLTAAEIADRWHRKDWWLTAGEAVQYGFADRIV